VVSLPWHVRLVPTPEVGMSPRMSWLTESVFACFGIRARYSKTKSSADLLKDLPCSAGVVAARKIAIETLKKSDDRPRGGQLPANHYHRAHANLREQIPSPRCSFSRLPIACPRPNTLSWRSGGQLPFHETSCFEAQPC
jgi:hypothetical protein